MYVLVVEFPPDICDACEEEWDTQDDRCSNWWGCYHSGRLNPPGRRSILVGLGRRAMWRKEDEWCGP